MELTEKGVSVDLYQRFRQELREQEFPEEISLAGNSMQQEIVKRLLQENRHIDISDKGEPVSLMSLEAFGSRFMATFLAGEKPPSGLFLLHTIPEELLVAFAEKESISVVREEKDDIRMMLDKIAKHQPQIYFALPKSASRLAEYLKKLE